MLGEVSNIQRGGWSLCPKRQSPWGRDPIQESSKLVSRPVHENVIELRKLDEFAGRPQHGNPTSA